MADRIVSLAPSATDILRAIGATDRLVGTTDRDESGVSVGGWLTPDLDAIADLDPDLVITTDPLQADIAARLRERELETVHFEPTTLDEAITYIRAIGTAIDAQQAASQLASSVDDRIERARPGTSEDARPVVYCEEWGDPPMVAGNWVPDVVRAAGGSYPFVPTGHRSRRIEWNEVQAATPDIAILHHCGQGHSIDADLLARRGWDVPDVCVIHDDLLNRPGPNLADAVERLAELVHAA